MARRHTPSAKPRKRRVNWARHAGGIVGATLLAMFVLVGVLAPFIAPYDPTDGDLLNAKLPPAWFAGGSQAHLLGTDALGQDILSRLVYGTRVSLTVGLFGVLLAGGIGTLLGLLAGYYGGRLDAVLTGLSNLILSIPYLILVVVVATVLGRSLLNVILLFGVSGSPVFYRLVRGEVLRIKAMPYVEAARGLGCSDARILWRHVLPNLAGPLLTLATFEMSAMIFYESGLGFLGLSVPPEVPSWGNMLALGRQFLAVYPWMAVLPGMAIALLALAINLLGEWLRVMLNP
ncbi:MAG: ABC transporter permease [Meiothermus sp.]|nr:MAG: ABC transporter permease [Meiothermus sp.]